MIGMMPWPAYESARCAGPPGSRLFLYSDGAPEIHKTDGSDWTWPEFVQTFTDLVTRTPATVMDDLHRHIIALNGSPVLDDDFSILDIQFM